MKATTNGVLLRNPILGVSDEETSEDKEALRMLEELIQEIDSSIHLRIDKRRPGPGNPPTPWLRTSRSFFRGLDAIKGFVFQEKMLHT